MTNFKTCLRERQVVIGTLATMASGNIAELLSRVGFDYIWIDSEHGPAGFVEIQTMIQAVGERCPTLVRVPSSDDVWIKKALDSGCDGVVVPQVNSAEEARQVVSSCYYPPRGSRSVGMTRAHGFGLSFADYLHNANDRVAVIVQVEHIKAVQQIDRIAAVEGLDAIFVGPFDLSGSLGLLAEIDHEQVQQATTQVLESCKRHDLPVGIFCVDSQAARTAISAGFTMIALGA
ncbi:2,4-dihydroxyhept-2-ene-1,7-dioic acid aldolase, partial [Candidatus Bipolaricaulota bacterium]|nr:2,4-dihydroxyhept-2-ene-1,7-dioic acid aldolase [Candidatus Bipolaricaulota bacterium]